MPMADESRNRGNKIMSARLAQGLAGGLCGWALLVHVLRWPHVSPFILAFSGIALLLSLKSYADHHARAVACFAAGMLVSSVILTRILVVLFWLLLRGIWRGGMTVTLTLEDQLLFVASVLFVFAGAFFWVASKSPEPSDEV